MINYCNSRVDHDKPDAILIVRIYLLFVIISKLLVMDNFLCTNLIYSSNYVRALCSLSRMDYFGKFSP